MNKVLCAFQRKASDSDWELLVKYLPVIEEAPVLVTREIFICCVNVTNVWLLQLQYMADAITHELHSSTFHSFTHL